MRIKLLRILLAGVFVLGLFNLAQAGKPQDSEGDFLGNGFPSGPHFNLNLKAKNDSFNCPTAEPNKGYCTDLPGDPEPDKSDAGIVGSIDDCNDDLLGLCDGACIGVYGNVINFPQAPIAPNSKLLMESGQEGSKGKAKKAQENPDYPNLLEVTDMCLGFTDNDDAAFRIPADPDGYAVYARITGDPKHEPSYDFTDPEFYYVQNINPDDPANLDDDFLALGYISPGGIFDVDGNPIGALPARTKGNKLPKATEITSLFMWSGEVCFLDDYGEGAVATLKDPLKNSSEFSFNIFPHSL